MDQTEATLLLIAHHGRRPTHVCGALGYGFSLDDTCPGCEWNKACHALKACKGWGCRCGS